MESEGAGLVEVRQEIDRLRAEMTDIGATNERDQLQPSLPVAGPDSGDGACVDAAPSRPPAAQPRLPVATALPLLGHALPAVAQPVAGAVAVPMAVPTAVALPPHALGIPTVVAQPIGTYPVGPGATALPVAVAVVQPVLQELKLSTDELRIRRVKNQARPMLYLHHWAMRGYWSWSEPFLADVLSRALAYGGQQATDDCCAPIQRVDYAVVSVAEFQQQFEETCTPALIDGATAEWPSAARLQDWSPGRRCRERRCHSSHSSLFIVQRANAKMERVELTPLPV